MRPCGHCFISGMPTKALEQLFLVVGIRICEIVLQDEIPLEPTNRDNVCEFCINESGYYE